MKIATGEVEEVTYTRIVSQTADLLAAVKEIDPEETSLIEKEKLEKIFRKTFSLKADDDVKELLELFEEDPVSFYI